MENKLIRFVDKQIDLPKTNSLHRLFRGLFGIGLAKSTFICSLQGVLPQTKPIAVPIEKFKALETHLKTYFLFGRTLQKIYYFNIKHKQKIGSIFGLRYSQQLPVHGQRTHSNARTSKTRRLPIVL
jgi:small subunit ribosomal protein S13